MVAIYAETDDFTDRQELAVYKGASREIILLQGVDTDTIAYRVKVRPRAEENAWSDVWEIRFVNGEYTVSGNAEDFDEAPPVETEKPPASTEKPAEKPVREPAAHAFPEPLFAFSEKQEGVYGYDLTRVAALHVSVNHCEYGEPTQVITDADVIANVLDALSGVAVTGSHDGMSSTGTHYVYALYDENDEYIAGFAFQDGMLMETEGRYPVSGLDALFSVEGVKLDEEWEAYWSTYAEKREAYGKAFVRAFPMPVFAAGGYGASLLGEMDPADLCSVWVRVSWNSDAGTLRSNDPSVIKSVYDALSNMRATGEVNDGAKGQKWTVTFSFDSPDGFVDSESLRFQGDLLLCDLPGTGTVRFAVDGLDAFFASADADVMGYLAEKRNETPPDPVY